MFSVEMRELIVNIILLCISDRCVMWVKRNNLAMPYYLMQYNRFNIPLKSQWLTLTQSFFFFFFFVCV